MSEQLNLDADVSRRRFLGLLVGLLNSLIALILAIPGFGYLLTPVFRRGSETWVRLGPVTRFTSTAPEKALFTYVSESGYRREERQAFVWVRRKAELPDGFVVFSPVCSHTGCNVAWQTPRQAFVCPCHNGIYDIEGNVVSGPPPRPLRQHPVKVENDALYIQLLT